jgi:hypothetical protein
MIIVPKSLIVLQVGKIGAFLAKLLSFLGYMPFAFLKMIPGCLLVNMNLCGDGVVVAVALV